MKELSQACLEALAAIEADPLALPPAVEAHVASCRACSEARVTWLAMEDAPAAQAPAGYFDHLPGRVLRKLPARPRRLGSQPVLWARAAGLIAAVGFGGYWLGQANKQPLVEATITTAPAELPATLPEAPFQEGDDTLAQVSTLTPAETKALMDRLDAKTPKP